MISVIEQRPPRLPLATACEALGLNRSTVYAWRSGTNKPSDPAARWRKQALHVARNAPLEQVWLNF